MKTHHDNFQRHVNFTSIDEIILHCFNTTDYQLDDLPSSFSPWATTRKLLISEKSYVLRILNNQTSVANKKAEITTHELFSKAGISPPLAYSNVEHGILIMAYIENDANWLHCVDEEKVRALANLLRAKNINIEGQENKFINTNNEIMFSWIDESLTKYTNQFHYQVHALKHFNALNQFLAELSQEKTLCHYELTSGNLLWDGYQFFMIDWELAKIVDPMFDLANVSYGLKLTVEQEKSLLKFYSEEHMTDSFQCKYRLYKTLVHLLYSLRLFALCKNNHDALSYMSSDQVENIPRLSLQESIFLLNPTDLFETSISVAKEASHYIESEQFEKDKETLISAHNTY